MGLDPQGHRSMVQAQVPSYPSQVHSIDIHLDGFHPNFVWIALLFGFRRVLDLTVHTAVALGSGFGFASSILAARLFTSWTFWHVFIIAQFFSHSQNGLDALLAVRKIQQGEVFLVDSPVKLGIQ